jgi:hypothetical protein
MKMFLAMLAAILVAGGIFCMIQSNQEVSAAHASLEKEMSKTDAMLRISANARTQDAPKSTPRIKTPKTTLTQTLRIKTLDGELTIPAGEVVNVANEKTKPGTVIINYEGYMLTIPATSVALSR